MRKSYSATYEIIRLHSEKFRNKKRRPNLSAVFNYYIVGYSVTTAQFSEAKRW